ncbi:glycosyltransferase family 4 protein [Flavobacterium sp. AG291]|uniref:glycosyltransferase family 4 protein n=1 Tax=Flavobacterium sp. AG291 TaxID=2184000 RepID=UPI000E0C5818|nr:glycosyltransferase family 4 protein [Flavobacterium sp. AG291]RDI12171.1 glycosyltransferase involved in cell wall biosynthesis [Flavobacterium sp. AG291]
MNWIISELFYPDEVSTAQILTDIALKKIDKGEVNVICGPSGYEKSYNTQKKELDSRVKIHRIDLPSLDKNKIIQRILRLLLLTLKMSWAILVKVKKRDEVFLTTNPTFLIITIAVLKKIKGFKLEILVHDVFPENLVPAGLIKQDSFKYRLLSKIYNSSYRKADRIIVLGEDMKELLERKIAPKAGRIDVIPNWSDNDIHPITDFNMSEYLGVNVDNKVVFGFAGNLGRVQGVLEFIDLFTRAANPDLALVIIGDGALRSEIQKKIKYEDLQPVHYLGPKPRMEQNLFLNACDIGVVTLIDGMKGLGVPSKTYNLLAAGKPLFYIGDHNSEIDTYVKKYDCGWSFTWAKESEILSFLKGLPGKSNEVSEKGVNALKASKNYEKDNVLNLF